MLTYANLDVSYTDARAEITVNRPEKLNALNTATLRALRDLLAEIAANDAVRVVLLTGAGDRAFIAGADIAEMAALDAEGLHDCLLLGQGVAEALEELPQPVLAVVNGYALGGGCELMLACDVILAAETAQIGLPEVDLAVIPGWGGTQRLPRRVGTARALELILTGARVPALEALRLGLVDRVVPPERLLEGARALADVMARKPPAALRAAKRAVRAAERLSLAEGLRRERQAFTALFEMPERAAAMARFLRKG
ncbi:MAG: enoyl-CoA hydratase/isomerase family protein [Armatimonadetes bacterium]|nr:enoyl-CoA hydratase/isomerase family protein [Armatimonadota bacterium]